jgi:hypothetical protein
MNNVAYKDLIDQDRVLRIILNDWLGVNPCHWQLKMAVPIGTDQGCHFTPSLVSNCPHEAKYIYVQHYLLEYENSHFESLDFSGSFTSNSIYIYLELIFMFLSLYCS